MSDIVAAAEADESLPVIEHGIPPATEGYRRYALGLLLVIYMLNFLDRSVINILAEPIKRELHLTDTEIGAMSGLAFALFYTFLGIAIARASERFSRPWIIGGSLALWSGFTAVCGAATNFWQMFAARLGVGFGEAGCSPAAHSLIADDTPKEKRSSALAFYAMGTPLGGLLGLAMGGILSDMFGWRIAFVIAGAPGLLFALIAGFTLKEPRERLAKGAQVIKAESASFLQTMAYLRTKPTFWLIAMSAAISAFIGYGQGPFTVPFYLRVHGAEIERLATMFGLQSVGFLGLSTGILGGITGAVGSLLGGRIADALGTKDLRNILVVPAVAGAVYAPLFIAQMLVPSATLSLLMILLPGVVGSLWYGPVYGLAQSVVPPHMRATTAAVLLFIINLIGLGAGPLVVGMISDGLAASMGEAEGVRWALISTAAFVVPSIACSLMARRYVRQDVVS
ncbi:MAG: MFS transporter [Caulobacteraceae bacterium]